MAELFTGASQGTNLSMDHAPLPIDLFPAATLYSFRYYYLTTSTTEKTLSSQAATVIWPVGSATLFDDILPTVKAASHPAFPSRQPARKALHQIRGPKSIRTCTVGKPSPPRKTHDSPSSRFTRTQQKPIVPGTKRGKLIVCHDKSNRAESPKRQNGGSSGHVEENTAFDPQELAPAKVAASGDSIPRPQSTAHPAVDPAAFYRKSLADLTAVTPIPRKRSVATAESSNAPTSRDPAPSTDAQMETSSPIVPENHSSTIPEHASAAGEAGSPVVAKKEPRNRRYRCDGLQLDNPFGNLVSEIPPTNARYATRRRTAEAAAVSTGGLSMPPDASSAPTTPVVASKPLTGKAQKGKTGTKAEKSRRTEKPATVETEKPSKPEKPVKRRRTRGPSVASATESERVANVTEGTEIASTEIKAEPPAEPSAAQEKETATAEPDIRHLESGAPEAPPVSHSTSEQQHKVDAFELSDSAVPIPTEDSQSTNKETGPLNAALATLGTESEKVGEKPPVLKSSNGAGPGSDSTEESPAARANTPEPTKAATKTSPPMKATAAVAPVKPTGGPGLLARAARRRRGADQQLVAGLNITPPRASSAAAPRPPRTFPGRITRNRVHEGESILALAFARTSQKLYSITKMACPIPDIVTDVAWLPALEDRCKSRFDVPDWVFSPRGRICPTGKNTVIPANDVVDPEFSTLKTNAPTLQDGGEKYSDLGHPTPPSESCDVPLPPVATLMEVSTEVIPSASPTHHEIAKRSIEAVQSSAPYPPAKRLRWRWLDPNPPLAPQYPDLHRFTHPLDETHTSHSHHLPIEHTLLPAPAWLPRELDDLAAGLATVGKSFTRIARDFVRTRPTADCVEAYYMRKHETRRAAGWLRVRRKGPVAMAVSRAAVAAAAAAGGVDEWKDGGAGVETRRTRLLKTVQAGGIDSDGTAHDVGSVPKVDEVARVEAVRGTGAGRGRRGRGGKGVAMK